MQMRSSVTALLANVVALYFLASPAAGAEPAPLPPEESAFSPVIDIFDVPTASTMYGRMFNLNMRFFRNGGILGKAAASFKNSLMLGLSVRANNVIGSGAVDFPDDPPFRAFIKYRFLNNARNQIMAAVGWDDQGYDVTRGRGLYGVVTKELEMSGFYVSAHAGMGMVLLRRYQPAKDTNIFAGVTGILSEDFTLGLEYDDIIYRNKDVHLQNGSFNIAVGFAWDVGLRLEIGFKNMFRGMAAHHRVLKISYTF